MPGVPPVSRCVCPAPHAGAGVSSLSLSVFPAPSPCLKGFKEHLWETKIAPVVRGLHPGKATERCKSASGSREHECPAARGCPWLSWCRVSVWARWVERKPVCLRREVGRAGLGSGSQRMETPAFRAAAGEEGGDAGSGFPSPQGF